MIEEIDKQGEIMSRIEKVHSTLDSVLVGKKVYIRAIEREDLAKRVEWINDPAVQRTLNFHYPTSLAKMQKWLDSVSQDVFRVDFSVFTCRDDKHIGFGGFLGIDVAVGKAELYAAIGEKSLWGLGGYGTDMYGVLVNYGFRELGLNRIYGYQLTFNRSAQRVVEKLGWKLEGVLRQDIRSHGELKDRNVVAILRSEWQQLQEGAQ